MLLKTKRSVSRSKFVNPSSPEHIQAMQIKAQ